MAEFLQAFLVVLLFAWVARALLDARELTWRRTMFAAFIGIILGAIFAAVLLVRDLETFDAFEEIRTEYYALAVGIAIIATMGVMVGLELLFSSRPSRHRTHRFRPFRTLRRWWGMWTRGLGVTRIVARQGLAPLVGLRRGEVSARSPGEIARRTRLCLEEAGGMFVKLGQLLVTRPDLLPPEALDELSRLQADVAPLAQTRVRAVVEEEIGRPLEEVFADFDWEPLGSASIGQAHAAHLMDGREVVVKVRRPGLEAQVDKDLAIVRWLARVAERRTAWGQSYDVRDLAQEFSDVLRAELQLGIEARHAVDMGAAASRHPLIRVPTIVESLTTNRMLVMERLTGTPLSKLPPGQHDGQARELADALCRSQVGAMLRGERFHGDPHPGNVLLLDDGKLGLVDFGNTGRLDAYERAAVVETLLSLRLEQPALLYDALMTIGAIDAEHDPDEVERALAQFLTSYVGSGLPGPEALTDLLRLTTRMGMRLPPTTTTMFRALATLAGTLETLFRGYPIFEAVADIGGAEVRERMVPASVGEFLVEEWAELGPLLRRAPRHMDRIARLAEHGRLTARVRLFSTPEEIMTLERLLNRAVTSFLSIGLGVVSVMLLGSEGGPEIAALEIRVFDTLGWATMALATILLLRVLLAILRTGRRPDRKRPG